MKTYQFRRSLWTATLLTALLGVTASAAPPVVKTVPWLANNPLVAHPTYTGKTITLKGTCDRTGLKWIWDFGDGSPIATGTISDHYAVEATHAYTAAAGTVFTARLTVQDLGTGETGTATYFVEVEPKSLEVEANVAIDEGLWYLHKAQTRSDSAGIDYGSWASSKYGGYANLNYAALNAANINALEVNGHSEGGPATNPYTETVRRGLHTLMTQLATMAIGAQTKGNPDTNGNGYAVVTSTTDSRYYQGGMIMDALVATGTPLAVTTTGTASSGANPGILGRTYRDILQDMVDGYAWAQSDGTGTVGGGWRYSAHEAPDNSACQWAAIGMAAAERATAQQPLWALTVPQWVKDWNKVWLTYSQAADGSFGYTSPGYFVWGPYATTPSGMVQMAWNGLGRGTVGSPSWDKVETYTRDRFGYTGGATAAIKGNYYGLFSFTKSMLLTPADPLNPLGGPIVMLKSQTAGVPPINWYAAEVAKGDPTDGVARTLIGGQTAPGYWYGNNYYSTQYPFETAWAITMLRRTLPDVAGGPVAVASSVANPAVAGQVITFRGSDSYQQDGTRNIVRWDWDLDNDGTFDVSGPIITRTFGSVGNYLVKLRVTDDSVPPRTADTILTVVVSTPPLAPTAFAGGPYVFCPQAKPWFLNGLGSVNPDEGGKEIGCATCPGDTIKEYAWDLDGDLDYNDAFGATPDLTAYFTAAGPGSYLVQLRVTDSTRAAYPSSTYNDLTDTDTAQVIVLGPTDPDCSCVTLTGTASGKSVVLSWTAFPGASYYSIYRSTVASGPYAWIQSSPLLTVTDSSVAVNVPYYYVVRPAALNGDELCQSNEVTATPACPPTVTSTPSQKISNNARYYRELKAASACYGVDELDIYVGDTLNAGFVAGPFKSGDVVRLTTGQAASTLNPGYSGMAGIITVKGKATVWALDPLDITGPIIISP